MFALPTIAMYPADNSISPTTFVTKNKLIAMTTMLRRIATILLPTPFTKSPMISREDEKAIVGIVANGS